jgi:hypothetical protein
MNHEERLQQIYEELGVAHASRPPYFSLGSKAVSYGRAHPGTYQSCGAA